MASVLAAIAAGAGLAALALFGYGFRVEWLIAAGLIVVSVSQISAIFGSRRQFADIRDRLFQVQTAGRQEHERRARLAQRIEELENRPPPPRGETQSLADEVKALRSTLKGLSEKQARRAAREPNFAAAAPSTRDAGGFSADKLDLYLEPIVEMEGRTTSHYRASVELRSGDGRRVPAQSLVAEAEQSGMRPALDRFALERCLRVATRILQRRPNTRIFVPIGLASYGNPHELQTLEALQDADRSVANALVFELSDRDLSRLDAAGMDGLAALARRGCTLALSFSRPMSADLPALRELNVRFLTCPARLLSSFTQVLTAAAKSGFLIVVSEVEEGADLAQAQRIGVFASGRHFAPPRLVRADLAADRQRARAAA
ncbi:MAG: EAL domain-containing protein [Rhizobiales bacterium]|nr:EAL domain-containing protein [Hyphomicrobiales bacterium]